MAINHLTLRQLQAIKAIYDTGQVSAAAERLSVSQSSASVLLGQAEATLGARLFDRSTRRVVPTEAVEQIIGIVTRIMGDVSAIGTAITDLQELERGVLRIAATPATGIALLPPTVKHFIAAYPRIALDMNDCAPDQFFPLIREEKVDFGLGIPPHDRAEFDWRLLHHDPIYLVCRRDHRLAAQETVRWRDLDGEPLIAPRRNYGVRTQIEDTLRSVGATANLRVEIGFLYSAEWMIACGMGLAAFPSRLAGAINDPDLVVRPLVDPVVTRSMAVISKRGRSLSPSAQRFVDMLARDLA
ncbi:LysR family transcriptional regulator [Roseinatronobacter alkalisoli]|uniref:LysR family transcriptional regulator n=1 Tax=Roseinatronobacter alkalisoli TaxID=3028235 RepID=A0ABT5T753_9RHOB|nr:LysR family transcriptional regulator [Roseinatronobacter sp. HJB301]MDD7970946.1 LysR family transcriptional regulator [Roseinatronobacter sp. HJB301]